MPDKGELPPQGVQPGRSGDLRAVLGRSGGLLSTGKGAEAVPLLLHAIAVFPTNPEAAHMLGAAYLQAGRLADGIEALEKAMVLAPSAPVVLNHLGVALCQAGRGGEGIDYLKKAVALAPSMAGARNNLAFALSAAGDHGSAADEYRAALVVAPQMIAAWQGLAASLHKSGDLLKALAAVEDAVAHFPGDSGFAASLGRVLLDLGRLDDAEAAFRRALALNPSNPEAANNLGTLIEDRGRAAEALSLYQHATRTRPEFADGWFNLGRALEKRGDLLAAMPALGRCASLQPRSVKFLSALIAVRRKLCDWPGLDAQVELLAGLLRAPDFPAKPDDVPAPFSLLSLKITAKDQRRAAEALSHSIERKTAGKISAIPPFSRSHGRFGGSKIRVGYLSPDFREHPAAQLIAGVIETHDRNRFEISAWSIGPYDASPYRRRIEIGADRFEDIRDLDPTVATTIMREAGLDIVVDLAGYTALARPEILARRVAPAQVNYLGYPGTMGAAFIDYIVADGIVVGEGDEHLYSERVIRLPNCYFANDDRAAIDPAPVRRADFGLPEHAFVFCCFSASYKIDAPVLDAWTEILVGVPKSVLWLFRSNATAADNLVREFVARGIAQERVIFADRMPKPAHLARHRLADLFLDTFAYGAHTTASDALWAGLPVLTMCGDSFARRVGASIVTAANMPELVTARVADYVADARTIALTTGGAEALKAKLAENLAVCPMFSTANFTDDLETAYLAIIAGQKT